MNAVDKYDYKVKTEQMLELMEDGAYGQAAEIADTIDWKRVRNTGMLANVSEIYEKNKEYQKGYDILSLAYRHAEGSRKIISRLCTLALKTGNVDEAIDYYDDFIQTAPKDPNQYILRYQILRAQRAPVEQQIEALEEYKKSEYIEEWAYELAKLYQEAGMTAECLEECDDLILWFSEGQYVYKAMELKMQYKPLTPSQQEKYDRRYEKLSAETEEMPDVISYAEAKNEDQDTADGGDEEDASDRAAAGTDSSVDEDMSAQAAASDDEDVNAAAVPEEKPKKKKIGDTMPLGEALRKLLGPEREEEASEETAEEEPELDDLADAIGEIESVADMDIVAQIADEKMKAAAAAGEMTEITPEEPGVGETQEIELAEAEDLFTDEEDRKDTRSDDEQITGQISLEDILSGWEGAPEEAEASDEELPEEAAEGAGEEPAEEDAEETDRDLLEEDAEEADGDLPEEDAEADDMTEGEVTRDKMETKKTTEPILPPDIQRMIDEIEGVIPAEEEKPEKPAKKTLERKPEEPRENMGQVADSLRIDGDDFDFDEDEELEDLEEDFDEDEELGDAEEYFDEDEELGDAEEYFDEDEELGDAEEYFDEDEEFVDVEEYFGEDEVLEEDAEISEESGELSDDEGEYLGEDEDLEDEAPDIDAEFRVNPEHADQEDDREIPDDEDDMDILSATTPLSRKETAKMIATGKTAPLPLDEISDALSMSDTGFIVHGRYDLEMQSGIGTRAGLTEEQKKLFSYFVPVRGMSEQLVDVLEQDKNCTNRKGTSKSGNLLIIGSKGSGKTVLAVDVVKAIQKQRNIKQGKVAIVTGDSLNKKKIGDIFDKLHGGALIIEKAGKMNEKTVARLNKAMERDTGELLIVLEEQRKPLDRLLSSNREFRRKFTSRLEIPVFINDELVTFGQTYAQENGYRIDEMGILALYSRIDSLQREDHAVTVAEVKEIMDEAIQHSQKASAKKLMKRVFGKNTDDADRIILSEKDFNI
ncbi:MAG TPA: AAA family ATPase [Candidatus Mediterraneibacter intestinipullorum]|nr:AAA family ATPase [Candidatus Mediterraneibacter intestinipullorum]